GTISGSPPKRPICTATLPLSASRADTRNHSTPVRKTNHRRTALSLRLKKSGRRPSGSMTQQQPALSPTPSRAKAFLNSLRYFFSWHCRPFVYGLLLMLVDWAFLLARAYRQLLKAVVVGAYRLAWPILKYILIRLAVALIFLILGSKVLGFLL